jgi:hypothetical protein
MISLITSSTMDPRILQHNMTYLKKTIIFSFNITAVIHIKLGQTWYLFYAAAFFRIVSCSWSNGFPRWPSETFASSFDEVLHQMQPNLVMTVHDSSFRFEKNIW